MKYNLTQYSFIGFVVFAGGAFLVSFENLLLYSVLSALSMLFILLLDYSENKGLFLGSLTVFVLLNAVTAVFFGVGYLFFPLILIVVLGIYHMYHCMAVNEVTASERKVRAIEGDKEQLNSRFNVKNDSLKALESKVDEIFKLFELAKDFNQCLQFQELISLLLEKMSFELSFDNCLLVILEGKKRRQRVSTVFRFNQSGWEESASDERFDFDSMIDYLSTQMRAVRLDSSELKKIDYVESSLVEKDLWLFPLIVEDKMIGLFLVEGGEKESFSKCSIIAAQLALHIKKINLYNTVKELSITDGLTGVFVRRHFLERFDEELKRSIKHGYHLSVLMLDIDHFKMYNDTFGHLVGDVTLREVSRIIKETVRKVDLISRYGGEEFAIVLPETDLEGGIDAAERIRSAVAEEHFNVYDEQTHVTVSIGVATFPQHVNYNGDFFPELAFELLHKADQSLYAAKQQGRNKVIASE